ncbi:SMI1/KNR4 family protein [Clostridium sp. UBA2485]|uniref:SMI1/KNR4 family protein n=1 Tax=Clostridium sp. UBA2485 TaxID=1946352 RepID=UPI0025C3EDA7|nr:SMI1/KNR4 family protein [Clostridium sp. UBA2485]
MPIYQPEQYNVIIKRIKEKCTAEDIFLGEQLLEQEICLFEKKHDTILPEVYRKFLLEVGDGCDMIGGFKMKSLDMIDRLISEKLSAAFPFEDPWIWEDEECPSESRLLEVGNGNIELIHIGDAQSYNLIVTGKCRGEIWFFCDVGIQPCCQRQDFLGWFEKWLDYGNDVDYFTEYQYE